MLGLGNSLLEVGIVLVVGQCFNNVGHADLEDDVHTALEVEAEADTHFATLLERPHTEIDRLIGERVEIVLSGSFTLESCNLLGLALVVPCDKREAEVEDADQCKQDSEHFYKSFVLHFV